jgi:tetratricopeptide (TPR) repeat protein
MQGRPGWAHNDYWNTLADWGAIGLGLLILPVAVGATGVFRSWSSLQRSAQGAGARAAVVLGAGTGLVSLLVHSIFDFNMHIPANALMATALLALITVHWRFATQRFWVTARWPVQIAATVVLVGAGVYLIQEGMVGARVALATREAEKLAVGSPERVAALKQAWQMDPRNGGTAYEIGEHIRLKAWAGEAEDYRNLTLEAIEWFKKAAALNKWDPHPIIRIGMCLDWIDQYAEAEPYFRQALELDPNHWFPRAMMGWHFFQAEEFAEVRPWMNRSLELWAHDNPLARTYMDRAAKMLAEEARRNGTNNLKRPSVGDER